MEKRKQISWDLWTHDEFPVFLFFFPSYIPDPTSWKCQETQTKNTATKASVWSPARSLSLTKGPGRGPPSKTDDDCTTPATQAEKPWCHLHPGQQRPRRSQTTPSPDCNAVTNLPTPPNHGHVRERQAGRWASLPQPPPHPTSVVSVGGHTKSLDFHPQAAVMRHITHSLLRCCCQRGPRGKSDFHRHPGMRPHMPHPRNVHGPCGEQKWGTPNPPNQGSTQRHSGRQNYHSTGGMKNTPTMCPWRPGGETSLLRPPCRSKAATPASLGRSQRKTDKTEGLNKIQGLRI